MAVQLPGGSDPSSTDEAALLVVQVDAAVTYHLPGGPSFPPRPERSAGSPVAAIELRGAWPRPSSLGLGVAPGGAWVVEDVAPDPVVVGTFDAAAFHLRWAGLVDVAVVADSAAFRYRSLGVLAWLAGVVYDAGPRVAAGDAPLRELHERIALLAIAHRTGGVELR